MKRIMLQDGIGYAGEDFNNQLREAGHDFELDVNVDVKDKVNIMTASKDFHLIVTLNAGTSKGKVPVHVIRLPLESHIMMGVNESVKAAHIAEVEDQGYIMLIRELLGTYALIKSRTINTGVEVPVSKPNARGRQTVKRVIEKNKNINLKVVRDESIPGEGKNNDN